MDLGNSYEADKARLERIAMVTEIQRVWYSLDTPEEITDAIWATQDGYGIPGYTPPQGEDWSGIRDSSESAVRAMYEIVSGA